MASFNQVILLGNLTRDPQSRQIPSGQVCEFGLATNRKYKTPDGEEREDVCFVDCAAFGRLAEVIAEHCRKGKALMVQGRLKFDTWEDRNGGGKRSKLTVVVDTFQFIGSRDDGGGGGSGGGGDGRAQPFDDAPPARQPQRQAQQQRPAERSAPAQRPPSDQPSRSRGAAPPPRQQQQQQQRQSAGRAPRQTYPPADDGGEGGGWNPEGDMGGLKEEDIPFDRPAA